MTEPEAVAIVERMKRVWSRWKPTGEEIQQWVKLLKGVSNYRAGNEAVDRLWQESRFACPAPKEFREILNAGSGAGRGNEDPNEKHGASGVWIECIEAPEDNPFRLGWHMEMIYGMDARVPENRTAILDHAETARRKHEDLYGGCWVVVQQATAYDMMQRKSALWAKHRPMEPGAKGEAT